MMKIRLLIFLSLLVNLELVAQKTKGKNIKNTYDNEAYSGHFTEGRFIPINKNTKDQGFGVIGFNYHKNKGFVRRSFGLDYKWSQQLVTTAQMADHLSKMEHIIV